MTGFELKKSSMTQADPEAAGGSGGLDSGIETTQEGVMASAGTSKQEGGPDESAINDLPQEVVTPNRSTKLIFWVLAGKSEGEKQVENDSVQFKNPESFGKITSKKVFFP